MPLDTTLWTLLHLLVFAYWLGGDIGVFYSSLMLGDAKRPAEARLIAGKILLDLDLVPRFCLLLALPTGLALAQNKGWLHPGWSVVSLSFVLALVWCFLVYTLHKRHGVDGGLARIDKIARWIFCLSLSVAGIAGAMNVIAMPLFLSLKLLVLGLTVLTGLLVRRALKPFGPAYGKLAAGAVDDDANRIIAGALKNVRPFVIVIWIGLILAAALGVAMPG